MADSFEELCQKADIISLHVPHTPETDALINIDIIKTKLKKGVIIINTARGKLVDLDAMIYGLDNNIIGGYLADVLDIEPMPENYILKDRENVLITPHISSRTYESVQRQGLFAVKNLIGLLAK
jgi:phosphoglycerate dehydrogenase-like enzyme